MIPGVARIARLPYQRQVLMIYIVVVFMTVIDTTMVNVALPTLAGEYGVPATEVEWVAIAYLLALASVIPAAGWLSDRFGSTPMFVWSLIGFTVASLLCGAAQTLDQLVAMRALQGVAGGLLTPIGSAMLYRAFPVAERAVAASGVLSVAVIAPALGPTLGGLLVDQASWRWIFLVNVPIGAIGAVLAVRLLRDERERASGSLDRVGLVLSATAMVALLYALSSAPEAGWGSARVVLLLAGGTAVLALFVAFELRHRAPLLDLRLLRRPLFGTVTVAAGLIYASFFGQIYLLPIFLQSLRGHTALESGLMQSPQAIGVMVLSVAIGARAYQRVGPRRLIAVGAVLGGLATASFGLFDLGTPSWVIALCSLLRGLSTGLAFLALQTAAYGGVSHAEMAQASSLFNTQRQFATATGVALAATLLASGVSNRGPLPSDRLPAFQHAFVVVGLLMIPAGLVALRIQDAHVAASRGLVQAES